MTAIWKKEDPPTISQGAQKIPLGGTAGTVGVMCGVVVGLKVGVKVNVGVGLFNAGLGAEGRVVIGLVQFKALIMTEANKNTDIKFRAFNIGTPQPRDSDLLHAI